MPTIYEIISHNRNAGHHFFDKNTLRFFKSRISSTTHGNYFITSERFDERTPRLYTVRCYNPKTGHIDGTAGGFQGFNTAREAHAYAERLHQLNVKHDDIRTNTILTNPPQTY